MDISRSPIYSDENDEDREALDALNAIWQDDLGLKRQSGGSLSVIVNLRDLSDSNELLGTLSFIVRSGIARVDELRPEIEGLGLTETRDTKEAAIRALSDAGGTIAVIFDAVSAATGVLQDARVAMAAAIRERAEVEGSSDNLVVDSKLALNHILLLKLDHMRQKKSYSQIISTWTFDLNLEGGLYFCPPRLILILLSGSSDSCREYLRRHRTQTVDVDSSGRKCKERMMDVLWEGDFEDLEVGDPTKTRPKSDAFKVVELSSRTALLDLLSVWRIPANVLVAL
jgi:hypothetical protein